MSRSRVAGLIATAVALVCTTSSPVSAQEDQTVAVTTFRSKVDSKIARKLAGQSRKAVVKAAKDWFQVVSDSQMRRARDSIRGDAKKVEERAVLLARATDAQVVLEGFITGSGRDLSLELSVRSPRDGQALSAVSLTIPSLKVDKAVRGVLEVEVPKIVLQYFSAERRRIAAEKRERERQEARRRGEKKDKTDKTDKTDEPDVITDPELLGDDADAEDFLEAEQRALARARARRRHELRLRGEVAAGVSLMGRSLELLFEEAANVAPLSYDGNVAGSAMVRGELYPLGIFGSKALSNLGFTFLFDRTLVLEAELQDQVFSSVQTRWSVGMRYRFPLGDSVDDSTSVLISGGYNNLGYTIDSGDMMLAPDVAYRFVDVGFGIRMPLSSRLALSASSRYLQVLSAGDISDLGGYQDTSAKGTDFQGRVDFLATSMIKLSLGLQFTRMSLAYGAEGTLNAQNTVNGGNDTYFGGYLAAGYSF